FFEWSPDGRFLLLFARFNKLYVHQQIPAYPITIDLWTGSMVSYPDGYGTADWVQGIGHLLRLEKNEHDEVSGLQVASIIHLLNPATNQEYLWQDGNYPVVGDEWFYHNTQLYFSCPLLDTHFDVTQHQQCKMNIAGVLP
ncbi:MAG TPA: hypothetical protein PK299_16105, partial [Anaerolineales bacterium]|nr:hypothetical protein [Anaerolineales bacterium]